MPSRDMGCGLEQGTVHIEPIDFVAAVSNLNTQESSGRVVVTEISLT